MSYSWYPDVKSIVINGVRHQKLAHCDVTDHELFLCDEGILCVYDAKENQVYVMNGTTKIHSMFKRGESYMLLDIVNDANTALQYVVNDAVYVGMVTNEAGAIEHKFMCHIKHTEYEEFCTTWSGLCSHDVTYDYGNEMKLDVCIPDSHFGRLLVKVI